MGAVGGGGGAEELSQLNVRPNVHGGAWRELGGSRPDPKTNVRLKTSHSMKILYKDVRKDYFSGIWNLDVQTGSGFDIFFSLSLICP